MFWLKIISITAQCFFTFIATTTQTKNKETNKLTDYGRIVAAGVIISTLFTIIIAATEQRDKSNAALKQAQLDSTRKALDSITIAFQKYTISTQGSLLKKQNAVIVKIDTSLSQQLLIKKQTLSSLQSERGLSKTSTNILGKVSSGLSLQEQIKSNTIEDLQSSNLLVNQQGVLLTNTERTLNPLFPCTIRAEITIPFTDSRAKSFLDLMERKRALVMQNINRPFIAGVSAVLKDSHNQSIHALTVIDSASYFSYNNAFGVAGLYYELFFLKENPSKYSLDQLRDSALNVQLIYLWPQNEQSRNPTERYAAEIQTNYVTQKIKMSINVPEVGPDEIHKTSFYGLNDLVGNYIIIVPHGFTDEMNLEKMTFFTGVIRARTFTVQPFPNETITSDNLKASGKVYVHKFTKEDLGFK